MSVTEILHEIEKSRKLIADETKKIAQYTYQLINANTDDWDWISVQQAHNKTGLSVCKIYELVNSGKIKSKRIGSKIHIRESELKGIDDGYTER